MATVCENILGADLLVSFFFDKCKRMPQAILCEYILGEESAGLQEFLPTQDGRECWSGEKVVDGLKQVHLVQGDNICLSVVVCFSIWLNKKFCLCICQVKMEKAVDSS